ncbi:MAG: D-alanine--D-alanine ligase [Gammaproteobacteria bacterium]|jgi:D-alanine-D-alanine ligase|nr:D-alanine--D-alanine ligase [Gammaproteobacteria bacterium]
MNARTEEKSWIEQMGRIAVLMGGTASEREISLKSGAAVLNELLRMGLYAEPFDPAERAISELSSFDRAFIVLHGKGGEDGVMQGVLESLKVPYTGSALLASALAMDKLRSKQFWEGAGLPTPPFRLLQRGCDLAEIVEQLGLPLMVKPVCEGSSIGMAKVDTVEALRQAWEVASEYEGEVIAEQWVEGAEYTVAILGDRALPMIRLQTSHRFYDYEAKYSAEDTEYLCPCGLNSEQERQLQQLAHSAFSTLGCSGWGRVDLMVDQAGSPWLLEVNTVPGMTDHSLVPMAASAAGLSFGQLLSEILQQS